MKKGDTLEMIRTIGLFFLYVAATGFAASAEIDDTIDIGGDFLFEYFFGDNFDLRGNANDDVDFLRTEFHLFFQADLTDTITTRISLEGDRKTNSYNAITLNKLDDNIGNLDLFVDEAFFTISDIGGSDFSASAGRQFLNFGDNPDSTNYNQWWGPGFIIADSRTNDPLLLSQLGSYEIDPFDAIVITHQSDSIQTNLFHARAVEEDLLGPSEVTDSDASMTALYASYFGIENNQIDLYAAYTDQNGPAGSLQFESDKWIVGGRTAGDISEEIAYKAEMAYQFEENDRNPAFEADAFGAQAGLNYHPQISYNPNAGLIYTYLQQEGMDETMSGFASPFEGKTYGMIFEGISKQLSLTSPYNPLTNMHVFNLYGGFNPLDDLVLSLDFYYFQLDDPLALVSGQRTDKNAGMEFDSQIDYQLNPNLKTFFGGGVFIPGDSLEDIRGNDDQAYFVRAGVKVSF